MNAKLNDKTVMQRVKQTPEPETCPSCNQNLIHHTNQQIVNCITKQLEEFNKQEKEVLAKYTTTVLTRKATHNPHSGL